ncbi:MAG: response regulator [Proteobacteria bacterium]|jgi:DNA-binding NtrC family response regulator|nr:response regulator [Desulfocapsa sp.]MBU3944262.1 response regulator [Pseudomonadota bacterium]MCG2745267.1 response regulator [Desulfobacteraceae bacterium]MBU3982112.1 response regulator [Pseudomonadota bacterium]MBU4028230.1 response regulator [Pseudomonadota bacterium]
MALFQVLVVDDEEEFRDMTIKRLSKRDIQAEGAESGEQALERIKRNDIDVVLLDVKMPGMGGVEALRQIKQAQPLIEVVMLTGHASVESGIDGMKLGAFDYLMKPMEFESLLEKLSEAYERKRIQQDKIERAQIQRDMFLPG